ncbi:MAG: BamA/OMP85 family outer membrane protein [Fervidobacterium sp.]
MSKKLLLITVFILALSVVSFSFVLVDVHFEGLKTLKAQDLQEYYSQYIGKDINENAISDIVNSIDGTGFFENIKYEILDAFGDSSKKILKINVVENPPIKKIDFEIQGPGIIDLDTVKKEVKLQEGKPFSFSKFWDSIAAIADLYSSKGFLVATPRSQDKSFGFIYVSGNIFDDGNVKFLIKENVLYDVGFDVVSDDEEFKDAFKDVSSKVSVKRYKDYERKNWFERLFDTEKDYIPNQQTLQSIFQTLSKYTYVKIVGVSVEEVQSKFPAKSLLITVTDNTITPQPIKLKGIKTVGNTLFTQKDLIGETSEGTYTNFKILSKVQQVKDKYDNAGYFINLNLGLDDDGYLAIKIDEIKVRQVKITGNDVTKDYVFNDVISVKPGDFLKRAELQSTYIELSKLNFFKNIDIGFEPVENDPTKVDVVVKIIEKDKKFDFQGGVTWGPVKDRPWWDGIAGLISISTTNPFGYGESLSFSLQKALSTTNLSLNAGIRKPLNLPLSISNSLSYQESPVTDGKQRSFSYQVEMNTLKTAIGQFGMSVGYKDITVTSTDTTASTNTVNVTTSANYVYETLDNLYVPMKGYSFTLSGTKYFPISSNGSDALSYLAEVTFHIPLTESISIASRLLAGQVFQNAGEPVTYELAGLNQVRGVKSSDKGTVIGLNNNEVRFKAPEQLFYISLFYDMGFVDNTYAFDRLVSSAGIEFGLTVPMFGLIRVGWGLPIPSSNLNFYFMFGKTF